MLIIRMLHIKYKYCRRLFSKYNCVLLVIYGLIFIVLSVGFSTLHRIGLDKIKTEYKDLIFIPSIDRVEYLSCGFSLSGINKIEEFLPHNINQNVRIIDFNRQNKEYLIEIRIRNNYLKHDGYIYIDNKYVKMIQNVNLKKINKLNIIIDKLNGVIRHVDDPTKLYLLSLWICKNIKYIKEAEEICVIKN